MFLRSKQINNEYLNSNSNLFFILHSLTLKRAKIAASHARFINENYYHFHRQLIE